MLNSHLLSTARLFTNILLWFGSVAALWGYARWYPPTLRPLDDLNARDGLDYGQKTGRANQMRRHRDQWIGGTSVATWCQCTTY
ncbi:hypothetical protein EDD16DRAFT_1577608 [Pisolithus croceorrhizus]|nr:hypothetical protein EDD16DRAFT_1577608 [Pisolithus croceorrhizus]KAI6123044.1 hypothetical protein EV401DRAFT_1948246 [Pisolithus croceorrhizus]